jgi:tetratricopeptide (TPR) repeat protein
VIVTLGYVETWFDRKLGLYLNVMPPTQMIRAEPDRFEFRVLSYNDVLAGLNDLYALLQKHRTKPLKMLVTVSPVPLLATFRDMDVLLANAYSKSVQRAALDEFLIGKTGVDYFPSFEFVTLSNPTVAWSRGDYRHVNQDVINRIMDNVMQSYLVRDADGAPPETNLTREGILSSLRLLIRLENFNEALDLVRANRALADADPDILQAEATAYRRLERLEDSFDAFGKAADLAPEKPDVLERMILLCRPMRRKDKARDLLARHAAAFPARTEFRDKVNWV